MQTGEGKTLVATLPAYLNALTGRSVHIVTVNDYLAKRDAQWMGAIYEFLGMRTGVVVPGMHPRDKRDAYAADVIYATNNELGFDYLRDNMAFSNADKMQRELAFAIVDEVDSILIDEARTPLIISGPTDESSELYLRINEVIPRLERQVEEDGPGDYSVDEKAKQVHLTEDGHEKVVCDGSAEARPLTAANVAAINHAFTHAYFDPIHFAPHGKEGFDDVHDHADHVIAEIREHHLTETEVAVRSEFAQHPLPADLDGADLIHAIEERLEAAGVEHDDMHDAWAYNLPLETADAELVRATGPIMNRSGFKIVPPRTLFDEPRDFSYDAFAEPIVIEPAADGTAAQICLIECEQQLGDHEPMVAPTTVNTAHIGFVLRLEEKGFADETVGHIFPIFRSLASDVNLPLAIALWSFLAVQYFGIRGVGVGSNFGKYIGVGSHAIVRGPMGVFVGILEIVSEVGRVISFTFRLFGNIFAGEVVLFISMFLVAFVVPTVFFGLEVFVGFIQAFVFAMLTLVFASTAVGDHDEHHDEAAGH